MEALSRVTTAALRIYRPMRLINVRTLGLLFCLAGCGESSSGESSGGSTGSTSEASTQTARSDTATSAPGSSGSSSSSGGLDTSDTGESTSAADTTADSSTGGAVEANCLADGACRDGERCTCPECASSPGCEPAACIDDGVCNTAEGCYCGDCAESAECGDAYCMSCGDYTAGFIEEGLVSRTELLCPEAQRAFEDLRACTCDGACADACDSSVCVGGLPSTNCFVCLQDQCSEALSTCVEDVTPRILCNPVTNEPCLEGETCDGTTFPTTGIQYGFQCYPPPNDEALCEGCDERLGTFCGGGLTCLDEANAPNGSGTCSPYCCTDADCGGGTCLTATYDGLTPVLGVCDVDAGSGPSCDAPSDAASAGSCVDLSGNE